MAEELLRFALFKEVPKRQRRTKRKLNNGVAKQSKEGEGSDESGDEEDEEEPQSPARMEMPIQDKGKTVADNQQNQDPARGEDSQDIRMNEQVLAGPTGDGGIRPERYVLSPVLLYGG